MNYRATRLIIRPAGNVPAGGRMPEDLGDVECAVLRSLGAIEIDLDTQASDEVVEGTVAIAATESKPVASVRRRRGAGA